MKKSLTMGLIFKISWGSQKFWKFGVLWQNRKKCVLFFRKILNIWASIFGKITPEYGYGSWAASSTSQTNPNLSNPPPSSSYVKKLNVHNVLAFVKGSVLVWVTDKYSEREAQALSAEGARVHRRRNASAASISLEAQEVLWALTQSM